MHGRFDSLTRTIRAELLSHTGVDAEAKLVGSMSSGQINSTIRLLHGKSSYFVKLNSARRRDMFEAEMTGLEELAATGALKVPMPVCSGDDGSTAFLVMEYLDLRTAGKQHVLGEGLACLHQVTQDQFGWKRDNTIGLTPQQNSPGEDWLEFWSTQRLGFQLELAEKNGFSGALQNQGERLLAELHVFFKGYRPRPALLHGDLWSGNYAFLASGEPVVFDAAVYFGDHEADLAMTELFGGFSEDFYAAYRSSNPLDPGYSVRKHLYNLYHVLNHLNLFGSGYLAHAESLMNRLLSESR